MKISNEWTEANVSISEVQKLLDQGYEVEVDSPDGYVPVNYFVDKGQYDEYVFEGDDGVNIRCNHRHLNLLDVTLDDLELLTREAYTSRIGRVKSRTTGKLVIKEYPTTTAGAAHFRHLLNELRLKKNFTPDIVYIDYLNICTSSRLRYGANVNSYTLVKSIAEELRGLAVEFNVPIVSATQTNRTGYTSSDVGLEDTSESFGLPATADFMFAMISTEELEELGQVMVKQLKNRWGDISNPKRFVVGIDRSKMRLFDAEDSAQEGLMKDGNTSPKQAKSDSVMDNSDFGERLEDEIRGAHRRKKPKFEGLN